MISLDSIIRRCSLKHGEKDAALLKECVEQGSYTIKEAIKIAKSFVGEKVFALRGEPNNEYPKGKLYTPESIVRSINKNGFKFTRNAAVRRLNKAKRQPWQLEVVLRPPNTNAMPVYKMQTTKKKDKAFEFKEIHKGNLSANESLYGIRGFYSKGIAKD